MLRIEPGWTTANPPDTANQFISCVIFRENMSILTEELLAAAGFFNNLDQSGLQLLDSRDVLSEDTHLSGFSGQVDLNTAVANMSAELFRRIVV